MAVPDGGEELKAPPDKRLWDAEKRGDLVDSLEPGNNRNGRIPVMPVACSTARLAG